MDVSTICCFIKFHWPIKCMHSRASNYHRRYTDISIIAHYLCSLLYCVYPFLWPHFLYFLSPPFFPCSDFLPCFPSSSFFLCHPINTTMINHLSCNLICTNKWACLLLLRHDVLSFRRLFYLLSFLRDVCNVIFWMILIKNAIFSIWEKKTEYHWQKKRFVCTNSRTHAHTHIRKHFNPNNYSAV